jgi:hypothetical protein
MEENQNVSTETQPNDPAATESQTATPQTGTADQSSFTVESVPPTPTQPTRPSTFQVVEATHGKEKTGFVVVHEVTLGDLTISFLLLAILSTQILRWLFKVVWGR